MMLTYIKPNISPQQRLSGTVSVLHTFEQNGETIVPIFFFFFNSGNKLYVIARLTVLIARVVGEIITRGEAEWNSPYPECY